MRASERVIEETSAGAAWVERFLWPHLLRRFSNARSLACLQVSPDDPTEAEKLRQLGHACEMIETTAAMKLPAADSAFDFAFTGKFPQRAPDRDSRRRLAREFHRVLRHGGSLLLALGNRRCPLDLTHNGPFIHGPSARSCLSLHEVGDLLIREAGFTSIMPLSVNGHFGWSRLPVIFYPLGKLLDAYWRFLVTPSRHWLYAGPLNPTLLLWLNKD